MQFLSSELSFPSVDDAGSDGLLCIGGDLSVPRLLLAYRNGIFPWYNDGDPICWWSPPARMVVFPQDYAPPKKLRNILNRNLFEVTFNTSFESVIKGCMSAPRKGQHGTWLSHEMREAYIEMYRSGHAKSVEVWRQGELVGGLYGIDLGDIFCGESMFSLESNASKYAFVFLLDKLRRENYRLLDCQLYNPYLDSLGAQLISRDEFISILANSGRS